MIDNNKHIRYSKILISIEIQFYYYNINQHIIMILIIYWIKSILIIIIDRIQTLIRTQTKLN